MLEIFLVNLFFSLYCVQANLTLNSSIFNIIKHHIVQALPVEPDLGEIPFQANLLIRVNNTHYASFCGGSLIHPRWILTAAHCLEEDSRPYPARMLYVILGSIYTNGTDGQKIQAEKLFINKLYFDSNGGYDIGLIKLKKNAILGKYVKPVKLHTNNSESLIGETACLTGYGIVDDFYHQPSRMRKACLNIDTSDNCLLDTRLGYPEICCTSSISEGKACKGDSGGPLTIKDSNGKYVQVGITSRLSFLPICGVVINNSIYTRVSSYISWISTATGIDFRRYVPRPRS